MGAHLWKVFASRRMWVTFGLGISSGLPLLLIGSTLKAWLKKEQVDLSVIGFFSIVGLPYTLKFLWSPFLDRFTLPWFGRRRGWILTFQVLLGIAFLSMTLLEPKENLKWLAVACFAIAFLSASQDIAIDAYRREILADSELALGSSLAVNGYRVGMLLSGALALILADQIPWKTVYAIMGIGLMGLTLITLIAPNPSQSIQKPSHLKDAIIQPFVDFFTRESVFTLLAFILAFKIGDSMASDMINPLLLDLSYSLTEIGAVAKVFGFWASILGGLLGGIICLRFGNLRSLWLLGIAQMVSTLGFSILPNIEKSIITMGSVILFETFCTSMATTAFVGFMSSLCNQKYTATQYALLTSLAGIPRVIFGATSGIFAKNLGWSGYYLFCTLLHLPGLFLLLTLSRKARTNG